MASTATTPPAVTSDEASVAEMLAPVLESFEAHRPGEDTTSIVAAGFAAELAHRGQVRKSGEDYVTHPIAVALTVESSGSTRRRSRARCCTTRWRTRA
jgi:GTP pyrophosphokinase